jgi:N-6 DNA Methylase
MSQDPELRAHKEWLGYLQPVGLVVSPAALRDAQAFVNKNIIREQSILIRHVRGESTAATQRGEEPKPRLKDFPAFAFDFWGWEPSDLAGGPGGPDLPTSIEVPLADYGEVLAPRYAVPDPANPGSWLMLIDVRADSANLDEAPKEDANDKRWHASPQARFERLLRANQVPIGLLVNPEVIRIVYAPRGESTGHLTFPVKAMCEVAGRPIVAALHLLLDTDRLFTAATNQRLPWILQQSRKYQNEVSTKLAEQVLRALNELMRGFQSANEATGGTLLADVLREAPQEVYGGLLSSLLRMVFILYAEDRGLLSNDPVYLNSYSLSGLFERLREDDAQYPDTMDQRFGSWAQFLTLCRLIYDGGGHGAMHLPPRHGRLFDPDAYSFLEGRTFGSKRASDESHEAITPPRVSDGVIFRVLRDLLMLDGERLSYMSLDVEQIGSVYEAMMGFEVRTAPGTSIGLRPDHVVVNLSDLLGKSPADRVKALKEDAGCELTGKALEQLKAGGTIEELVAAFGRRVSPLYLDERGMPLLVALGGIYLQPTEERRRSGSHYTPRSLTEPIVRTTLEPILKQLGEKPRPEQILDLKICDPAMGSGAFLVETCRFLAEALVESWSVHGQTPFIPPDQEPVLHARRLIAQRCLYGVDKNPFAVDLAKLSLWLATLAKDHAFTFLDHSLRHGDSLVGLTRKQLATFHWLDRQSVLLDLERDLRQRIDRVSKYRKDILSARDEVPYSLLQQKLEGADESLTFPRMAGDAVIAAFFSADKPRDRENARILLREQTEAVLKNPTDTKAADAVEQAIANLSRGSKGITPFHWELEFPEVFTFGADGNPTGGFDAIVGNPPFAGKNTFIHSHIDGYGDWLKIIHEESHGNADLVAHFFRRAFDLLRDRGVFGLIATNTIGQGDTRATGLRWICQHDGKIFAARRRVKWPGRAAVVVSEVHVVKGAYSGKPELDGRQVEKITAFLFHGGADEDPARLAANAGKSFIGSYVLGMGFTFDDSDTNGVATPLAEMRRLIEKEPRNAERIFPYIGGDEINSSPVQSHHRCVINFGEMSEAEARRWPDLMAIIEEKVKPERMTNNREVRKKYWWRFGETTPALFGAIAGLAKVLVAPRTSKRVTFVFLGPRMIYSENIVVFTFENFGSFALLQSSVHDLWVRFTSSTLGDDIGYRPSDCFETFPFPHNWETCPILEAAGKEYYEFRAALMVKNNEGLTKTYNRFHDPEERSPEIVKLRKLHAAVERAVLNAYEWNDIPTECKFLLDYEIDEEEWGDKKKPWRYRWPDEVRDEVLARLLELNRQRAEEEQLAGAAADSAKTKKRAQKKSAKVSLPAPALFSAEDTTK